MKLTGQRWHFELGNSTVFVDNAFNLLTSWSQERIIVNDEIVSAGGGYFRMRGTFSTPWLTRLGESDLIVRGFGRLRGVEVIAMLDGERQEPVAYLNARWQGRGTWPAADAWQPGTAWIVRSRGARL